MIFYIRAVGVGEVPKVLNRIGQPLRAICIIDSDLEFPGHEGKNIKTVEQACSNKGLVLKIWIKRMIENYLPDHVIKEWMRENKVNEDHMYFKMNRDQKRCFNLKSGLKCKDAKKTQINRLYGSLLVDIDLYNIADETVVIEPISKKLADKYCGISTRCGKDDFRDDLPEFEEMVEWIEAYM